MMKIFMEYIRLEKSCTMGSAPENCALDQTRKLRTREKSKIAHSTKPEDSALGKYQTKKIKKLC